MRYMSCFVIEIGNRRQEQIIVYLDTGLTFQVVNVDIVGGGKQKRKILCYNIKRELGLKELDEDIVEERKYRQRKYVEI